jgi:hypothetical protein
MKDPASILFPKYLHENHLPVEKKYRKLVEMIKNKIISLYTRHYVSNINYKTYAELIQISSLLSSPCPYTYEI